MTLAKKHQEELASHFEKFKFKRLTFGPISQVLVSSLEGGEALNEAFDVLTVSTTPWVKSYGKEYQVGCMWLLELKMRCLCSTGLTV